MGALFLTAIVEYGRGRRDKRAGTSRDCMRCRTVNASDNTWCWNCGADLDTGERSLFSIGRTDQGPGVGDADSGHDADSNPPDPQHAARSKRGLASQLLVGGAVVAGAFAMAVRMSEMAPSGSAEGAIFVIALIAVLALYNWFWVRPQDKRFREQRLIRASSWTRGRGRRRAVTVSTTGTNRSSPFQPFVVPDLAVTIDHVIAMEEYSRTDLGATHRSDPELREGWEEIDARVVAALSGSNVADHQHLRSLSKLVVAARRDPSDLTQAGVLLPMSGFRGVLADEGLTTFGVDRATFDRVGLVGLVGLLGDR